MAFSTSTDLPGRSHSSPKSSRTSILHADTQALQDREVDVDAIFHSLEGALRAESWISENLGESEKVASFLRQKLSTWVRVETGTKIHVASAAEVFPPPEAVLAFAENSELRLLEVLKPGEVKIRCNVPPTWRPLVNSLRALAEQHWRHPLEETAVYMASRQETASPGRDCHSTLLLTQPPFTWILRAVPHREGAGAGIISFFSFPEALREDMAKSVTSTFCQVVMRYECLILQALTDQQMTMARCRASSLYVVLALRKCSGGAPFLPKTTAAICDNPRCLENWHQMSYAEFTFPLYLRTFFRMVNLGDYEVFESLNGRSLVPYQAVMKRADWTQCKDDFLAMFNLAGRVYRQALRKDKPQIMETARKIIDAQDPIYEPKRESSLLEAQMQMAAYYSHKDAVYQTAIAHAVIHLAPEAICALP